MYATLSLKFNTNLADSTPKIALPLLERVEFLTKDGKLVYVSPGEGGNGKCCVNESVYYGSFTGLDVCVENSDESLVHNYSELTEEDYSLLQKADLKGLKFEEEDYPEETILADHVIVEIKIENLGCREKILRNKTHLPVY